MSLYRCSSGRITNFLHPVIYFYWSLLAESIIYITFDWQCRLISDRLIASTLSTWSTWLGSNSSYKMEKPDQRSWSETITDPFSYCRTSPASYLFSEPRKYLVSSDLFTHHKPRHHWWIEVGEIRTDSDRLPIFGRSTLSISGYIMLLISEQSTPSNSSGIFLDSSFSEL